jgi:hypothetical protein
VSGAIRSLFVLRLQLLALRVDRVNSLGFDVALSMCGYRCAVIDR